MYIYSKNKLEEKEFNTLKELINAEMKRQTDKFGKRKHNFEMFFMILMEEIGEISHEFIKFENIENYDNVKNEIIQSITLLCQMLFGIYSIDFSIKE